MLTRNTRRRERASVIIMMPVGVLVLIILGSIAVDFSHLFLEQRELQSAAQAAANDAAGLSLDVNALRNGTSLADSFNGGIAKTAAVASVAAEGLDDATVTASVGRKGNRVGIFVTVTRTVDYIFAPAVPGGPKSKQLAATGFAVLSDGQ